MNIIREKSGFTLAETMILMAIIGVMTTIAIPNIIEWLPKIRVNGAIRNLAADMQWTRMRAVARNNDHVICFDVEGNIYSIYDVNDGDDRCNPDENTLVKRVDISAEYPGITYGCNNNITPGCALFQRFQPTGLAAPNTISVYLIPEKDFDDSNFSRRDRWRKVSVARTGRIKIWYYNGKKWI